MIFGQLPTVGFQTDEVRLDSTFIALLFHLVILYKHNINITISLYSQLYQSKCRIMEVTVSMLAKSCKCLRWNVMFKCFMALIWKTYIWGNVRRASFILVNVLSVIELPGLGAIYMS